MISGEELKKLSKLARIEISEGELSDLGKDINSILDYVGQITQINADKEPQMNADKVLINIMREDENPHEGGEFSSDLLNEAPNKENGYVKVKKIL
ncbi:MAG: aspartyl-tRNA(Asn)/glutamyl-tRNA (Gln) amidotransferase subunit C [Parcubacteria group bacterium Athens0714_16]|nr:MAG: aspartyl-tRNA(Asn)/glutamyl-tRNA (Gln) amidotransferase subunit C [Parcubacteria group bacterium Athens0714_16]